MIQRFGIQRFDGLSMVNLKPSKPLCQIVPNLNIPNLHIQPYGGYRGYIDTMVCYGLYLSRRLLAGRGGVYNKPSYIKPSYGGYQAYMRHGGLKV